MRFKQFLTSLLLSLLVLVTVGSKAGWAADPDDLSSNSPVTDEVRPAEDYWDDGDDHFVNDIKRFFDYEALIDWVNGWGITVGKR